MKKWKSVFLIFYFCFNLNATEIKNLRVYNSNFETSFPILIENQENPGSIIIEFDVKSNSQPSLNILFRFCDKNWQTYDSPYLENRGQNTFYNLSYEFLPNTVKEANYFFKGSFPDKEGYVTFPFSGKWKAFIIDEFNNILSDAKFYVINNKVLISSNLKKETLGNIYSSQNQLTKVFRITSKFELPDEFFPQQVELIEIVENKKLSFPIIIERKNLENRFYNWDGNRKFTYTAADVFPGNSYRQTDFRNYNRFNSKNINANIDGMETSRFYQFGRFDNFGNSLILNYKDLNATYHNVEFKIAADDFFGDIYLTGSFINWEILPEYKMENRNQRFYKTVELKRGIYDYQYVAFNNENYDWTYFEGNFHETEREYHIFLYYKDFNFGGYDTIIGVTTLTSNKNEK